MTKRPWRAAGFSWKSPAEWQPRILWCLLFMLMGNGIAIFRPLYALMLGEETADEAAGVFVGTSFTRGIGAAAV